MLQKLVNQIPHDVIKRDVRLLYPVNAGGRHSQAIIEQTAGAHLDHLAAVISRETHGTKLHSPRGGESVH